MIVGVQFADSDFSGSFEDSSLIVLSDSFDEIFFHLSLIELKVVVDVERSEEDFLFEVGDLVEGSGFFGFVEFDFDDTVFGVERECFDFAVDFLVTEIKVGHFVLESSLHVLNDNLFAVFNLLVEGDFFGFWDHRNLLKFNYKKRSLKVDKNLIKKLD